MHKTLFIVTGDKSIGLLYVIEPCLVCIWVELILFHSGLNVVVTVSSVYACVSVFLCLCFEQMLCLCYYAVFRINCHVWFLDFEPMQISSDHCTECRNAHSGNSLHLR